MARTRRYQEIHTPNNELLGDKCFRGTGGITVHPRYMVFPTLRSLSIHYNPRPFSFVKKRLLD